MAWSTQQLADIAGTTLRTVRHYHHVGLLPEPARADNGYKQYDASDLILLLRVKRLADLGIPLSEIAEVLDAPGRPEQALRVIDAELEVTIERLQRVKADLEHIVNHRVPPDLPSGFAEAGGDASETDRAFLLVYSHLFDTPTVDALRDMLHGAGHTTEDREFDALPADADEHTKQDLAERYAPAIGRLTEQHSKLSVPESKAPHEQLAAEKIVAQTLTDLYNAAQFDVLRRVHLILRDKPPAS